jgi:hypothetical protein
MTEMTDSQSAKIRKGLAPTRDPTCYQTQQDIVIPAGTILRSIGDNDFGASIGISTGTAGAFIVKREPGCMDSPLLKRVMT